MGRAQMVGTFYDLADAEMFHRVYDIFQSLEHTDAYTGDNYAFLWNIV